LDKYYNLGAISDIKIRKKADNSSNSDFTVLTSSYEKKRNQVSQLQSGVGLTIEGCIEYPYLEDIFVVDFDTNESYLTCLTTPLESTLMLVPKTQQSVKQIVIPSFLHKEPTQLLAKVSSTTFIQVTRA
jgi:hypothetical protein